MITINLLPEEFRVVEKKQVNIPLKKIAFWGGGIFVAVSLLLYADFLIASMKLKSLENAWKDKQPAFQQLSLLRNDVDGALKHEKEFMEKFVTSRRPLTHLMMWASEYLPETVWLTEFKLTREEEESHLMLKGLAIPSREKSSIEQIEDYLQNLKDSMPDVTLSLTTTRQTYNEVSVTEFVAQFGWEGTGPA